MPDDGRPASNGRGDGATLVAHRPRKPRIFDPFKITTLDFEHPVTGERLAFQVWVIGKRYWQQHYAGQAEGLRLRWYAVGPIVIAARLFGDSGAGE